MRVPNEKKVATIRLEGEFPPELNVYGFEFKLGWKIDFKKDDTGKIVGATWTGTIVPYEFVEFGILGLNPTEGKVLTWRSSCPAAVHTTSPPLSVGPVLHRAGPTGATSPTAALA